MGKCWWEMTLGPLLRGRSHLDDSHAVLSPKLLQWVTLFTGLFCVQLVIQLIAFMNGLILIRSLEPRQYAYFTLTTAALGMMALLSDMGTSIGLSKIGGKVWRDPHRFGQLLSTTLKVRRYLALPAILVVVPFLLWMLLSNGSSPSYSAFLTVLILSAFPLQLTVDTKVAALRLGGQIARSQYLDLIFHGLRLMLLGAASLLVLDAHVALVILVVGLALQGFLLNRWLRETLDLRAPAHPGDHAVLLSLARSLWPNTIFYCVQGQLTVWLAGTLAGVQTIAEVSVLGRLALIFTAVQGVFASAVLPYFARCQSGPVLRQRYFQIIGGVSLMGMTVIALSGLLPKQLLWVLGEHYSHLESVLVLAVALAVAQFMAQTIWVMNAAKGWVEFVWLHIPGTILVQVGLLLILDVSTTRGILAFTMLSTVPSFVINGMLTYRGLKSVESGDQIQRSSMSCYGFAPRME